MLSLIGYGNNMQQHLLELCEKRFSQFKMKSVINGSNLKVDQYICNILNIFHEKDNTLLFIIKFLIDSHSY